MTITVPRLTEAERLRDARGAVDAVIVDYGTPNLAREAYESMVDHPAFATLTVVDALAGRLSYAQAVNRQLALGHAPIVLALNADTRMLEPPNRILRLFGSDPRIAIIGPRQINSLGRVTHAGIFGSNTAPQHRHWQQPISEVDGETSEACLDAVSVPGSVFFCRRSVWEQLGGFNERCAHFYEETSLVYDARHHGWRVCYTGQTTWLHEWKQSPVTQEWLNARAVESREQFRRFCDERGIEHD
jgi:GT2 family glycosyltransferase